MMRLFHLVDDPLEDVARLFGIGDDGRQKVGDVLVDTELDPLRVDQDHLHFVRRGLEQDGTDQAVEKDGLAASGRARDEEMRHAREIADVGGAVDRFTQDHGESGRARLKLFGFQNLPQADRLPFRIRDLDPDRRLPGDAIDAYGFGLERETEIFGKRRDLAVLDSGVRFELERRHDGAGVDLLDVSLDGELPASLLEELGALHEVFFVRRDLLAARLENAEGRHVPSPLLWIEGKDLLFLWRLLDVFGRFRLLVDHLRLADVRRRGGVRFLFLLQERLLRVLFDDALAELLLSPALAAVVESRQRDVHSSCGKSPCVLLTAPLNDQCVATVNAVNRSVTRRMNAPIGLSADTRYEARRWPTAPPAGVNWPESGISPRASANNPARLSTIPVIPVMRPTRESIGWHQNRFQPAKNKSPAKT